MPKVLERLVLQVQLPAASVRNSCAPRGCMDTHTGGTSRAGELALIFSTIHRILIVSSPCYLNLEPRRYTSMIESIKPDARYATGFVTISYICSKVSIRYTVKGACKEARSGY